MLLLIVLVHFFHHLLVALTIPFSDRPGHLFAPIRILLAGDRNSASSSGNDHYVRMPVSESQKEYRKNWARLIQNIYEVDFLTCAKFRGTMRIISFIEDREVIETILKPLGVWLVKSRPTPTAHAP